MLEERLYRNDLGPTLNPPRASVTLTIVAGEDEVTARG